MFPRRYFHCFTGFRADAREKIKHGRHDFIHASYNRNMATAVVDHERRLRSGAMHGLANRKRSDHILLAPYQQYGNFQGAKSIIQIVDARYHGDQGALYHPLIPIAPANVVGLHEIGQARSIGRGHGHELIHLRTGLRREDGLVETQVVLHAGAVEQH